MSNIVKPILIFRHDEWVNAGYFAETLKANSLNYEVIAIDQGESIPAELDNASGLAFLGGTMSVNDSYAWINDELNLIRLAAKQKFPVFGHCFGAQLISKALGGEVVRMPTKEIGWHEIKFLNNKIANNWFENVPNNVSALLWHEDAMTLPPNVTPLYSTIFNPHQAFTVDNIVATIPHVETTSKMLLKWLDEYGYDLSPLSASVQSIEEVSKNIDERITVMQRLTNVLYERWLNMLFSYHHQK